MVAQDIASLLHHCSKIKEFRYGLSLHASALKKGLLSHVFVSNHALNMYAKCGNITFARKLFDEMPHRNLVSWSAIISGYCQLGHPLLALHLFPQLHLVPNEFILASAITACASLAALPQGQQLHTHSFKFGCASVSFVSNALTSMYMKCGLFSDALSVHNEASLPNLVSYNALISGFLDNQEIKEGFQVFFRLQQQGLVPDRFTLAGLFGACSDLRTGEQFHGLAIKLNLDSSAFIGNVIITMYSKLGLIEEGEKAFRVTDEKDLISWNTLISTCSHCNDHERALRVFEKMSNDHSVMPDDFTLASVLAACAGIASICNGKQIHAHIIRTRLHQDIGVHNALVNMYAKCGFIGNAYQIFSKILQRNIVSWNTMIAGFANHGLGQRALELFKKMMTTGIKPDSVTFVGILTACNHAGLVDEGQVYFNSMEETYGISPSIEHFSCLIDLLGRAGRLHEAEEYMKKFPFGNDPVVLGTMLSSCRLHGNVIIGERLARQLVKLQPLTTSPYVLLSNLYASDDMWDGVSKARKMLKVSGLKKEPGYSLVDVNGTFERFKILDCSHSRIEEIKDVLKILSWEAGEIFQNHLTKFFEEPCHSVNKYSMYASEATILL